jgi:5'-3' exonuclease
MGINGLTKSVNADNKSKIKQVSLEYTIPLKSMGGKTIAIDTNAVYYSFWSKITGEECFRRNILEKGLDIDRIATLWIDSICRSIAKMTSFGVKCVLVFDGAAPEMKSGTQKKRKDVTDNYLKIATDAVKAVCELVNIEYIPGSFSTGPIENLGIDELSRVEHYRGIHRDAMRYGINPIRENWNRLALALSAEHGVTCVRSNVEAETLCCKMVLNGEADYVLSPDSDCLAYRVPVWLRSYDSDEGFIAVNLSDVINRIGILPERFLDYCIMCGCDYNKRVSQKIDGSCIKMGPVNITARLKRNSLDDIIDTVQEVDWSILEVDFCRSIFNLEIDVCPMEIITQAIDDSEIRV